MFGKQNTLLAGVNRCSIIICVRVAIRTRPRVVFGHIGDTTQTMQIRLTIHFHDYPPYDVTLGNSYCSVSFKTTKRSPKNGIEPTGATRKRMELQEQNSTHMKIVHYNSNIVKKKMGNIIT